MNKLIIGGIIVVAIYVAISIWAGVSATLQAKRIILEHQQRIEKSINGR
jgi:cell division protein FtsL